MEQDILDADLTPSTEIATQSQNHNALAQANQPQTDSQSMMRLIEAAMSKPDFDVDKLERLMAVKDRWQAQEAKNAFVVAMAEFKKNPPTIIKDKQVSFTTDKGTTSYKHATIGNVVEKVVAALAEHGFSHRWVPGRKDGGMITITCVITHKLGHSEETELEAGLDMSGGKNNIQAMISTKTYLERHSLLAAVGLATIDQEDDDGRAAGAGDPQQGGKKKSKALPIIQGKAFNNAIAAVKRGEYTGDQIHEWYALSEDQETALTDAIKEMKKAAA